VEGMEDDPSFRRGDQVRDKALKEAARNSNIESGGTQRGFRHGVTPTT